MISVSSPNVSVIVWVSPDTINVSGMPLAAAAVVRAAALTDFPSTTQLAPYVVVSPSTSSVPPVKLPELSKLYVNVRLNRVEPPLSFSTYDPVSVRPLADVVTKLLVTSKPSVKVSPTQFSLAS